ncbi:hypothetical protein Q7P37_006092 [Cladosporium fusiforme]
MPSASEPKPKDATQQSPEVHDCPSIDPWSWSDGKRRRAAVCMGLMAFLEPFASSMIAPSLDVIAQEFHVTSSVLRNLLLSSFVLPYAFGTLLLAPISEIVGRRPVLLLSAVVFLAFTIACGVAQNSTQFIVFRVLAGLGGCVPLAVGVAMIGDLYAPHERGSAMAFYMGLQLGGPVLGPIVGGWILQSINSWRWSFYACSIATAIVIALVAISLPETYAPKLSGVKHASSAESLSYLKRPFVLIGTQPIIQVLALYAAIIFGTYYLFLTTISSTFHDHYGHSIGISTLHYLAMLLGFIVSVGLSGRMMDSVYQRLTKEGAFPEARIPYLAASGTILPAGLLLYGWTAEYKIFWVVPDIGLFLVGLGILAPLAAIQHYILDCYSKGGFAASALAGMNVLRFLAGFGFPLFADNLFESLGLGWGNSVLALVAATIGCLHKVVLESGTCSHFYLFDDFVNLKDRSTFGPQSPKSKMTLLTLVLRAAMECMQINEVSKTHMSLILISKDSAGVPEYHWLDPILQCHFCKGTSYATCGKTTDPIFLQPSDSPTPKLCNQIMTCDNATLPALCARTSRKYPKNEAIDGLDYSALHDLTNRYVAGLGESDIRKGDAVCSFFGQKLVHAAALALAIMRIGAVHVPLASSTPERRLSEQCQAVGKTVKLLVYGPEATDRLKAEAVAGKTGTPACPVRSMESASTDERDISSWDDHAIILFTSGSSGPPKATGYKHKQLATSLRACAAAFSFSSTTRICNIVPYVWDGGNLDLFGPLLVGGAVRFAHDMSPTGIQQTIRNDHCTHVIGPPSLLHTIDIETLCRLKVLISAGESASVAQFRDWKAKLSERSETRLFNAYGLTESGIVNAAWECPAEIPPDMQSVPLGLPLPGNHINVDEANSELIISGPQVTEGYLGKESSAFIEPPSMYSKGHYSMRTGDSGWRDSAGLYHIGGRLDDQLSIFSVRIEPEESETVALTVPGIDFAHLFIHELGETQTPALVLAYHVAGAAHDGELLNQQGYTNYETTYEKQIREHMRTSVPGHQCPSAYIPLGSIPRTISNKKDKCRIAALALEAQDKNLLGFAPFSLDI